MKCNKCGSEWRTGKSALVLSNCPFCGASLIVEEQPKEVTLGSALKQLIDDFGISILQNHKKCVAILRDTAPQLRNEQKVLEVAFNFGISSYFINCPAEDRKKNVNRAMQAIEFLNNESKELVITAFVKALNWDEIDLDNLFGTTSKNEVRANQLADNKNADKSHQSITPENSNDEDEDFESCKAKAESGNAESQYRLGCIYLKGEGVTKNNSQAFKWFKAAAEQEHAKAQYELGNCYMNWIGTSKDTNKAIYWYERAAVNGYDEAKKKLDKIRFKNVADDVDKTPKPWAVKYSRDKQNSVPVKKPVYNTGNNAVNKNEVIFKQKKDYAKNNYEKQCNNTNTETIWQKQVPQKPKIRNVYELTTYSYSENDVIVRYNFDLDEKVTITDVCVKVGDEVCCWDVVLKWHLDTFRSRLSYVVQSEVEGIVTNVYVKKGDIMNKGAAVLSIRPCKVNKKQTYYEPIWKYGNENQAVRFIKGLFGK